MAHYNLVFQGKIVEGASLNKVKLNIAQLFKITAAKVEPLFSGKPIIIKKNLDTASAKKYLLILKKSGAIVKAIKLEEPKVQAPKTKISHTQETKSTRQLSSGLASLINYNNKERITKKKTVPSKVKPSSPAPTKPVASSASQKLRTEVKKATHIPQVDHLTMSDAQSGSLEEFATVIESIELPDIDNLSMSDANTGSMEEFIIPVIAAELPDIAYINLSQQDDTPLSSQSPKQASVAIPDISNLSMSDPQEGTLEGLQEKLKAAKLPDISHLRVSD